MENEIIKNQIYTIRNQQVMLDRDLAELYEVETRNLNKAVKRNIERFPEDFMFQLTAKDIQNLKFQFGTSRWGGIRYLPYAFTEQGVAMLSGILRSHKAIEVNIAIMRIFIAMRKYIGDSSQVFARIDRKLLEHDQKFEEVFNALEERSLKPSKGIFFNGQMFDAYKFVSGLIRSAKKSVILIDNYVDETVLVLLGKISKDVKVTILTKNISRQLELDIRKYNSQYHGIEIKQFSDSHDRFLIIDNKEVYHFGASLKDLGKKWFAFSKFDKEAFKLIEKLDSIQA
jgi:hypothetical protein